ncbi:hypothetical protein ACHAQJ_005209 [Trichoderma viride]
MDFIQDTAMRGLLNPSVPNLVGQLGELQPVSGRSESWNWMLEELKSYPQVFAQRVETSFIHKKLARHPLLRPLRVSFGICAACICINESNKPVLFQAIKAETSELTKPASNSGTLLEDLSRLQAIVLYTIIRLFYGDMEQQSLAEQQKHLLGVWGFQLLQRADVELRQAPPSWESWILTESIRRTVLMAYMVYGVYSVFKYGICTEVPTLAVLPMSTKQVFWASQATYANHFLEDKTINYDEYSRLWLTWTPRRLESFEKVILVACKGIEAVEAFDSMPSLSFGQASP